VIQLTGAAVALPAAAPIQSNSLENMRMAFTPKFVDLVCNYTTTVGTGDFALGPVMNGFTGFATALQAGDNFYYSVIGLDRPTEREVGSGTLLAIGRISRDPVSGVKTSFTSGTKMIQLVAAAEWFNNLQARAGAGATGGTGAGFAASRSAMAAAAQTQSPVVLSEKGREGMFVFDGSNLAAKVAADAHQGIYVAPSSDPTGATGAWVRKFDGPVELGWFGVADGVSDNAERCESAFAVFGDTDAPSRAGWFVFPQGNITMNRRVLVDRPHRIEGRGQGSASVTWGDGPTVVNFPPGSSGFRFKHMFGGPTAGAQRATIANMRITQEVALTTTGTGSYNPATPKKITLSSAGDFANGQIVCLEGAGPSLTIQDRTAAIAAGTKIVTITETVPNLGNPGVYLGQHIDIAGAGLPAGTTVVDWGPSSITLSNNAAATVSGAAYTVKLPLIGEIQSGGGTTTLTIDTPEWQTQAVSNAVLRHFDSAIYATCTIQVRDVDTAGFAGAGMFLRGDSTGANADNSQIFASKISGLRCGAVMQGTDAQAISFFGCNFGRGGNDNLIGVLDMSMLGSDFFGCHWAFGVGILVALPNSYTRIIGGYLEGGTSFVAPANALCSFYGTTSMHNGSGWNGVDFSASGLTIGTLLGMGGATFLNGDVRSRGLSTSGSGTARFCGGGSNYPVGTTGVTGLTLYRDAGYDAGVVMAEDGSAYKALQLVGASVDLRPNNVSSATIDASGLNLASGKVLKVGGTTVVGARQTGTPADATDLASAIALVNALKAKLVAHGLIA
jgi:hypothetical protein